MAQNYAAVAVPQDTSVALQLVPERKRQTHQSIGFIESELKGFMMMPKGYGAIAIENRLTGSQYRLWHYLMMVDPFANTAPDGDRIYHNIPSPAEIALKIGASPRTVEKDMRRLQELGLYTFRIKEWQGYNLTYEEAKRISDEMKQAKADQKRPKPAQDKSGYLAGVPVILPESVLNNRDGGYLAETEIENPLSEKASSDSSVALDIKTNLDIDRSLKERETREEKNQEGSQVEGGNLNASAPLKVKSIPPQQEANISKWDQFSAPRWDPEFFEYVVNRTPGLPNPPVSPRCVAESWIRSRGHLLYPEYLDWKEAQKRADERMAEAVPVEAVPVPMVEAEPMTPQKWLERYQGMWEADERSRQYIRKAITQHPERGVCLGENGPELMAEEGRLLQRADLSEGRSPELELMLEPSSAMPEDFSDVLAGIDVEIRRLAWSASQLSAHLRQAYGKKSRQQLTDQELLNLLFCLQDEERLTG